MNAMGQSSGSQNHKLSFDCLTRLERISGLLIFGVPQFSTYNFEPLPPIHKLVHS